MNENPIIPEKDNNIENLNLQNEEIIEDISPTESINTNNEVEKLEPITPSPTTSNLSSDIVFPEIKEETPKVEPEIIETSTTSVNNDTNSSSSLSSETNPVVEQVVSQEPTKEIINETPTPLENPNSEPVSQQQVTNSIIEMPQEKSKKSKKGLIIGLVIIILIVLALVFGFFYMTNPKKIFSSNLSKMYNNILNLQEKNKVLSNILNSEKVGMQSDIKVKLSDSQGITKDFSDIGLTLDYRENKKNNEGYLELDSTLTSKNLIGLETVMKDNKAYIKLKDVMDKYYYTEYEFISLLSNQNNEDFIYLLDIAKKHISSNIDDNNIKSTKVTEKINNKDEKLKKISLEVKEQLLNKIALGILEEVKKDDKAINIIVDNFEVSEEYLLEEIDQIITGIKETTTDELLFTYSMYVKNYKDVLKQDIVVDTEKFEIYNYDKTTEIKYVSSDSEILQFKVIGDKNNGEITGLFSTLSITGKYTNNSIELTLKDSSSSAEIGLKINYNENEISDTEYQYDMSMEASILENNTEVVKAEITMDTKFSSNVEMPSINISSNKDINEMTEEEQNEIMTKIMSIPVIQELVLKYSENTIE